MQAPQTGGVTVQLAMTELLQDPTTAHHLDLTTELLQNPLDRFLSSNLTYILTIYPFAA